VTAWNVVLLASVLVLGLKIAGYLVPARLLERPTPARVATLLTVALLSALVVTQTIQGSGGHPLSVDARLPALGVAAVLLAIRAPFIVVVVAAAVVAAVLRLLGWMA
jgi:hypothetical protein